VPLCSHMSVLHVQEQIQTEAMAEFLPGDAADHVHWAALFDTAPLGGPLEGQVYEHGKAKLALAKKAKKAARRLSSGRKAVSRSLSDEAEAEAEADCDSKTSTKFLEILNSLSPQAPPPPKSLPPHRAEWTEPIAQALRSCSGLHDAIQLAFHGASRAILDAIKTKLDEHFLFSLQCLRPLSLAEVEHMFPQVGARSRFGELVSTVQRVMATPVAAAELAPRAPVLEVRKKLARAEAPAKPQGDWTCSTCTFVNQSPSLVCEMCANIVDLPGLEERIDLCSSGESSPGPQPPVVSSAEDTEVE
jgi:hypothetical protein